MDFFKYLYEAENSITDDLHAKSRHYITLHTAFIAAVIFKLKDLDEFLSGRKIPIRTSSWL